MGQCLQAPGSLNGGAGGAAGKKGYEKANSSGELVNGGGRSGPASPGAPPQSQSALEQIGLPSDPEERQIGCYLRFDPQSSGTLYAVWSETELDDHWGFFHPRKNVPKFKFKQNGGKIELYRNIGVNKTALFNGLAQFIKMAYDFDGILNIEDDSRMKAEFYMIDEKNQISQIQFDSWMQASDICVVAVVPRHNQAFNGVKSCPPEQFIDIAKSAKGYSWQPLRK